MQAYVETCAFPGQHSRQYLFPTHKNCGIMGHKGQDCGSGHRQWGQHVCCCAQGKVGTLLMFCSHLKLGRKKVSKMSWTWLRFKRKQVQLFLSPHHHCYIQAQGNSKSAEISWVKTDSVNRDQMELSVLHVGETVRAKRCSYHSPLSAWPKLSLLDSGRMVWNQSFLECTKTIWGGNRGNIGWKTHFHFRSHTPCATASKNPTCVWARRQQASCWAVGSMSPLFQDHGNILYSLAVSTYLDIRFKNMGFCDSSNVEPVKAPLVTEMQSMSQTSALPSTATSSATSSAPAPATSISAAKGGIWAEFDSEVSLSQHHRRAGTDALIEMCSYTEEMPIPRDQDPLLRGMLVHCFSTSLSKLAKRHLGVVATSVPAERLFSKAGQLLSIRRCALKPKNVNMILFLNKNL